MHDAIADQGLKIFSTCPPSISGRAVAYRSQVEEIARWSEDAGCEGILVYTDNGLVDPWLVSQVIIGATEHLCPLVAVQPVYMHPYSVAKMVASIAFLHGRRVHLNMVAGGFANDLAALNDPTPHDERYARLVEYTEAIQRLLQTAGPVTYERRYYRVSNLKLTPALPPELMPEVLISGSSEEGILSAPPHQAPAPRDPKTAPPH